MNLDDYFEYWQEDSKIDRTELGEESIKIPQLHYKYYKFYSNERLNYTRLVEQSKQLKRLKYEHYMGTLSHEDYKDLGWEPNQLKILKADVPMYMDSDQDIIDSNLKIAYAKEKIDFLENVIRTLNTRGYQLKNAIDWERFKVGA